MEAAQHSNVLEAGLFELGDVVILRCRTHDAFRPERDRGAARGSAHRAQIAHRHAQLRDDLRSTLGVGGRSLRGRPDLRETRNQRASEQRETLARKLLVLVKGADDYRARLVSACSPALTRPVASTRASTR